LDWDLHVLDTGESAIFYLDGENEFNERIGHPAPDIIITESKLPKINGELVLEWIRGNYVRPQIPVFLHTSQSRMTDRADALRAGFNGFFSKSVSLGDLLQTIREIDAWRSVRTKVWFTKPVSMRPQLV
jgi:CheY-like chemotaxis protein